jgi:hypothetical protein
MAATAKTKTPEPTVEPLEYPEFETEEDARQFWSSHSTAPYWHLMEEVTEASPPGPVERPTGPRPYPYSRPKPGETTEIAVRLPAELVDVIQARARRRAISLDLLLTEWLGDRIKEERRRLHGDLDLPADAERPFR